jgi:hypothetical protein
MELSMGYITWPTNSMVKEVTQDEFELLSGPAKIWATPAGGAKPQITTILVVQILKTKGHCQK